MANRRKEKDVSLITSARGRRTKTSNLVPKKIPQMMPGYVISQMVKCGKQGCKCSRGELHGPYFYHLTWHGNGYEKSYIRLSDVAKTVQACKVYRDLQAQIREGNKAYKALLARARELFG